MLVFNYGSKIKQVSLESKYILKNILRHKKTPDKLSLIGGFYATSTIVLVVFPKIEVITSQM